MFICFQKINGHVPLFTKKLWREGIITALKLLVKNVFEHTNTLSLITAKIYSFTAQEASNRKVKEVSRYFSCDLQSARKLSSFNIRVRMI